MPSSSELKQMVLIALAFWLVVILLFCVGCTHHPDRLRIGGIKSCRKLVRLAVS